MSILSPELQDPKPAPEGLYKPPKSAASTSLLEYVNSRSDLSTLTRVLTESAGFLQAFDTVPTWNFTFFAPSDTAFKNTGEYFETFAQTPKGKWWLGNLVQHHYIPNSQLKVSAFSTNFTRIQTGTFLYIGAQIVDNNLVLNRAATVAEADIPVTNPVKFGVIRKARHPLHKQSGSIRRQRSMNLTASSTRIRQRRYHAEQAM
ncbi:hypothetical protein Daesc_009816 [Daldinia eschscholtzii]|uniref:FAS1 domain-containing protein n=1 Tax=Daldinia eschscholtzii TaxID=292717 RepID=A0AAX6M770_9PEZI